MLSYCRHLRMVPRCFVSQLKVRSLSTESQKIIVENNSQTGIATLYLNNPPANFFDRELLTATTNAIRSLGQEESIRGVILTSRLDGKIFSAGLNIYDIYQKPHVEMLDFWTHVQDWVITCYSFRKPLVAAINGHAIAGGCALAMMCDYRIMHDNDNFRIGMNEVLLGIAPTLIYQQMMARIVGETLTERLLTRGTLLSPKEALKIGLINDLTSPDQLISKARSEIEMYVRTPVSAFSHIKLEMRKDVVDRLISTRQEDAKSFADLVFPAGSQNNIGKYLKSLKERKK